MARGYRGYSQEEIAAFLGISRSSVSLMESGDRGVDSLEIKRLSDLYECTVDELLTNNSPPNPEDAEIGMVARAASRLSAQDRAEVLRFAQFLRSRKARQHNEKD